jgi:small redox-active disulfide protein 2
MKIKILGAGCARCRDLEKTVRETVKALQLDATVEDITDMKQIMQYHILATPGLVIDDKVVMSGKVPAMAEVERLIINALAAEEAGKS